MAQTTNPKYILDRMRAENIRNFRIFDSDKKTVIEDESANNLTVDQAIDRVQQTLNALTGLVWVELCNVARGEKAAGGGAMPNKWIALNLGGVQGIGTHNQAPNPGGNFAELMAAMEQRNNDKLEALKKEFEYKNEINDLKRQLAESGGPLEILKPHIPAIITGIFGARPAAIAGHNTPPAAPPAAEEHTAETVEFAELQLSRLLAVDPQFLQVLEKLADMAENEPQKYQMAKNFL